MAIVQPVHAQIGRSYFGSLQPKIAVSGNNIDIVWQYWNPDRAVYMVTSNDSGTTLGDKTNLSKNSTAFFSFGNMVTSKNNIYYAWENNSLPYTPRLFLMTSADAGLTFGKPVLIASHDRYFNEEMELDKVLASGKNVYVIWSTNRDYDGRSFGTIFLSKSTDGGLDFASPVPINTPDTNWSGLETATSGNKTYFLWQSIVNSTCIQGRCDSQIHLRSADRNGTLGDTFSPLVLDKAEQVQLTASGDNVYLTGVIFEPNYTSITSNGLKVLTPAASPRYVFFTKSDDGGATFGNVANLNGSKYYCTPSGMNWQCSLGNPYSYVSGRDVYIIWDATNYTANDREAFFANSVDGGNTFGKTVKLDPFNLDNIDCDHVEQCVSVDAPLASNGTVYLAWSAYNINSYHDAAVFAKSTDGGKTLDYTDISNSTGITTTPVIARGSGDTIYVAGLRSGFQEGSHAIFAKSTDGGNSFDMGVDLDMLQEMPVPEFPFAVPILLIGFISVIVFYRTKIVK
ncbi:MAG: hypothetical protein ACREA7_07365 [Nitrosotalea sp.]